MTSDINNPLFQQQREKSGSQTFNKYRYQYHWALLHALEKYSLNLDHAVFVELHEDVISVDSISKKPLEFDYFQIKCLTEKKLSIHKIAAAKTNGETIFGKILSNYKNNSLRPNIKSLNLVSQFGFSLNLVDPKKKLDKIKINDLIASEKEILENCIKDLNLDSSPSDISFITPALQENNQDSQVIGEISTTINKLYPNKNFNPCSIYNILINNLYNKGCDTVDYKNWQEALNKKSITSNEIKKVVHTFIEDPLHENILNDSKSIINDLKFNSLKKIKIRNYFNNLIIDLYNPTSYHIEVENIIKPLVAHLVEAGVDDIEAIIEEIKIQVSNHPRKELLDVEDELIAHIILYILQIIGI